MTLELNSKQKVILLAGPSGAGKSTIGRLVARNENWVHLSEDDVWSELDRIPRSLRTEEEKKIVQPKAIQYILNALQEDKSILFEFIIYEDPPQPLMYYQSKLKELGVLFETRVLLATVDELLKRQEIRGREFERDIEAQRLDAQLQVDSLDCDFVNSNWVVYSTNFTAEEIYASYFASLVEDS